MGGLNSQGTHTQKLTTMVHRRTKTAVGIGAGITGPRLKLSLSMGIFQAEVYAITKCAEVILDRGYHNERIAIISDSQAALQALSSFEVDSGLVMDRVDTLNSICSNNSITLTWVSGHKEIQGNELADQLARKTTATSPIGPEPFIAVGRHVLITRLKEEEAASRNRIIYRPLQTTVSSAQNGNPLVGSLPILSADSEAETPEHLLLDCPAIAKERGQTIGALYPQRGSIACISPATLLRFLNVTGLEGVL
ncbi:uncharacterized protein LOC128921787 [Zeugodacus cucurbitae]|uniref:uncharacterized protein LOC128921787 n=1 Tax=Zeugodacus cucurbitae TaxID=28588 RepID=UPI0023D8ECD3|nr:uncharacterized protein LOC128921787 [Zeugodacus cucurbitae]